MSAAAIALVLHVGLAAVWDIAQRRIPNWLIVSGLILGFAFSAQSGGFVGLGLSLLGALLGLLVLIGPFALRWMGGGDVKLVMVCGAFLGWEGVIHVVLVGTVLHGLMGFGVLALCAVRKARGQGLSPPQPLPHAVGFGVATMLYVAGIAHFI